MTLPYWLREPSQADLDRISKARRTSHRRLKAASEARKKLLQKIYRAELAATVRKASPFMVELLQACNATLDDVAELLKPNTMWTYETEREDGALPRFAGSQLHVDLVPGSGMKETVMRSRGRKRPGSSRCVRCVFEIYQHAFEVTADFGNMQVSSRHGRLAVQVTDAIPLSLQHGLIGKPIGRLIDFSVWNDKPWPVVDVNVGENGVPVAVIVSTGMIGYRVPWSRARLNSSRG